MLQQLKVFLFIAESLNGLALGKAQFSLKALCDVVFRQGHEGGSVWVEMERAGG
jgi:hypothetical protein